MPVSFTRLRIAGFKSFAEPAVVDILPGLTGVVGPNGCGKSNVVEALRWAMGENSARSLRGGEMDDVIFAGTANRASRNLAEVTLQLADTQGTAPPPFHEAPELEISRRIERGGGSVYRINGAEARARDVQTLFADLATGARSSGMVSQGRVTALVSARPDERRAILEEAAGITGLHSRRHEAELKLRAAEANLGRAEDLKGQLETQLEGLKRQARQANRYRAISGLIRSAEAEMLAIQRAGVEAARAAAHAAHHQAEAAVATATAATTAAATAATEAAAVLPALREAEGESRTALERHRLAGEQIAAEEARAREALAAAVARLEQVTRDLAHAEQTRRDALAAMARLDGEAARLNAEDAAHPARLERAEAAALAAADAARGAEATANRATEHAADVAARHRALSAALAAAEGRARRLAEQQEQLAAERREVEAQRVDAAALAAAEAERQQAEAALVAARAAQEQAEEARAAALQQAAAARAAAAEAAQRLRAAATETAARLRRAGQKAATTLRRAAQERAAALRGAAREQATRQRAEAEATLAAARAQATAAESARTKLAAEVQALAEVLAVADGERWPRMVDQLEVPAGLEAALGAALGEELESAADTGAARHWRELPPLDPVPALPEGVTPLAALVRAPPALARALSQIGLAEDGSDVQGRLLPGQALVSRAGAVWRWDGYVIQAGTPTPAAIRLQQRNRLVQLRARLAVATADALQARTAREAAEAAEQAARTQAEATERAAAAEAETTERSAAAEAEAAERTARSEAEAAERGAQDAAGQLERDSRDSAESAEQAANAAEQQTRAARRDAEQHAERARAAAAALAARAASTEARLQALDSQADRLAAEAGEAGTALAASREAMAGLADPDAARAAMEQARAGLAAARARETETRAERDALARGAAGRAHRRRILTAEREDWGMRARDVGERVTDLAARTAQARAEHAARAAAPDAVAARHAAALDELEAAEATHRRAADALAAAEAAASGADRAARAAEAALAAARERVVRLEGEATQAEHAWGVVAERILERLGANPAMPDPPAQIGPDSEDKARRKLERLQREREEMGPVNLRAEVEAEELATQIDTILRECGELTAAIAKLRGSIGHLNREGRERLSSVFTAVDGHFQALFARMFGGGRAHLALVGSDDPLLAGLEIYAQPPGKKLATLSLLSGGEQALTALSLIFAVFRCNPAPVCVLDEVDAPLDDANVERYCLLLEDMVRDTGTRFMVVTHHHLTMARMDRLYGVTMQERGVSRLLSVDLQRAAEMVDPPRLAAE